MLAAQRRFSGSRLRIRTDLGVSSTSSSSSIHSSAVSSVIMRGGRQPDRLVMAGGADIGELFLAAYVDRQIGLARILADDHALVNRLAGCR